MKITKVLKGIICLLVVIVVATGSTLLMAETITANKHIPIRLRLVNNTTDGTAVLLYVVKNDPAAYPWEPDKHWLLAVNLTVDGGKVQVLNGPKTVADGYYSIDDVDVVYNPAEEAFMTIWTGRETEGSVTDLYTRKLDKKGKPLGEPAKVISGVKDWTVEEFTPRISLLSGQAAGAPASAGEYLIAWWHDGLGDADNYEHQGLFTCLLDDAGVMVSGSMNSVAGSGWWRETGEITHKVDSVFNLQNGQSALLWQSHKYESATKPMLTLLDDKGKQADSIKLNNRTPLDASAVYRDGYVLVACADGDHVKNIVVNVQDKLKLERKYKPISLDKTETGSAITATRLCDLGDKGVYQLVYKRTLSGSQHVRQIFVARVDEFPLGKKMSFVKLARAGRTNARYYDYLYFDKAFEATAMANGKTLLVVWAVESNSADTPFGIEARVYAGK